MRLDDPSLRLEAAEFEVLVIVATMFLLLSHTATSPKALIFKHDMLKQPK